MGNQRTRVGSAAGKKQIPVTDVEVYRPAAVQL